MKTIKQHLKQWASKVFLGWIFICFISIQTIQGQAILDSQNRVDITLDDGTIVVLYGKAKTRDQTFSSEYLYLPVNLHLSKRPDGTPEFLFLKYTTEERADAGGAQGALMHFLMEWGLSDKQLKEAEVKLKQKITKLNENSRSKYRRVKNPVILGAADVKVEDGNSFRIISSVLTDEGMAKVIASGNASPLPGSKIAVAAKLDKTAAQLLAATFEKNRSITDVSLELSFKYDVLFPAVDGKIVIDWKKIEKSFESFSARYTHNDRDTKSGSDDRYSYNEVDSIYKSAIESKAVIFEIDKNTTDDETADKIVESFMNVFTEALTDRDATAPPTPPSDEEAAARPNIRHGSRYVYNQTKAETRFQRQREVYNLKYRVAIPKHFPLTGNLGSWYDGVRDNPKCISSVNLNDPFFQHRDINLILDLKAENMFGTEVNYVTVNVRKRRNQGNDFQDQVTIDRDYLKEKGVRAALTYARGEDKNPDVFEYKMQWSLSGGYVYPEDPEWIVGDWEGVPLAAPVLPRTVELEGDIDELKDTDIVRVTAAIRYYKFGKEVETNIPLTVSKETPLVAETFFTDKDTQGYAYRLIFTHKKEGKLALPWETKINDNYIYASIPEAFQDNESEVFKEAKEAGKEILDSVKDKVLDKFKDVLKVD
ncbi:hypothetical protein [Flavivirga sp. 57AJ16]|uniref:hypothetical protein n=1 Tax=Flavivirga sp. 57AJ16 TaxID=3025307 RepID=UPI002365BBFB|nr:hypothetical protein [Flavivirga sp. 57AJ16]MDD7887315.1 hypothetical protein [Flavivirga sp. 57AJ16]